MMTIDKLIHLKESEDKVEFKEAANGNISYNGGQGDFKKRRRCILGYVTAFANEGGGFLVFGIKESTPHIVVGSKQSEGSIGLLESKIYNDTGIRVEIQELYTKDNKRVLVIKIPTRPKGKVYKFEDVALMRVGEELKPMSDEKYLNIIQEQEDDFSEKICEEARIEDLDDTAIRIMQEAYARKQNNEQFLTLNKLEVLNDLKLVIDNKVTNAAVILVGKREFINKTIPQSLIQLEYRGDEANIIFDQRHTFSGAYFLEVNKLWETINLRNGSFPIQEGLFIFDIPYFNKEVIREAINNAVAHRNYRQTSEIVIKQYPSKLEVYSPGGFPIGVHIENLISVSSTPRNRLLADVLQKTGIVERSGQGIDKIYYQTLKEGKSEPDYSNSDDFQVKLVLSSIVEDKAFAVFIESVQSELDDNEKLSVHEIIHLNNIRKSNELFQLDKKIISKLLDRKLIEKRGKTRAVYYILSKKYYEYSDEKGEYAKHFELTDEQAFLRILEYFENYREAKTKDFISLFDNLLNRKQVRFIIDKLVENKHLKRNGKGSGTFYTVEKSFVTEIENLRKTLGEKLNRNKGDI